MRNLVERLPMTSCEPDKKVGIEPMTIRTYTVAEFCATFKLSRPSVYRLLKSGELHSIMICGRRLISPHSAEALLRRPSSPMTSLRGR